MIYYQSEESVQQRQIDLLIQLLKMALHHDIALSFPCLPHFLQVIDTCTANRCNIDHKQNSAVTTDLGTICKPAEVVVQCQQA